MEHVLDFDGTYDYLYKNARKWALKHYINVSGSPADTKLDEVPSAFKKIINTVIAWEFGTVLTGQFRFYTLDPLVYRKVLKVIVKEAESPNRILFKQGAVPIRKAIDLAYEVLYPTFFKKVTGGYPDVLLDIIRFTDYTGVFKETRAVSTKKLMAIKTLLNKVRYYGTPFHNLLWSVTYQMISVMSFINKVYGYEDYYIIAEHAIKFNKASLKWLFEQILELVHKNELGSLKMALRMWGPFNIVSEDMLMIRSATDQKAKEILEVLTEPQDIDEYVDIISRAIRYLQKSTDPVIPLKALVNALKK